MKKGLLFGIFMIMSVVLLAQENASAYDAGSAVAQRETHVTPAQALNVGYTFMRTGAGANTGTRGGTHGNEVPSQAMQLVYTGQTYDSLTGTTTDCYYVFALQPKGFVIVAADDRVEPILGYSYDNNFVVENMPDHVRGWLGSYERQIEAVAKSNLQAEPATQAKWSRLKSGQSTGSRSGGSVGPLLTTTWDQGQYYNALCPADASGPDGHVWAGCVATAMAQIIHYWSYPTHGRGTHSYNSNYGTLTVNYGNANYDYTNMPVSLSSGSTSTEIDAVASLMRDCGVAVNMSYAADESSAFDQEARAALINFFQYSPNMSFAEKAYFSNDEWETMLRNDLDAGNPVFYSGQGTGGHAFVCDGYNADGYFSFNFGWGGYCNGWYLTSNVNPGGNAYNDSQSAIFGITPDANGNVILGQMTGTSTFTVGEPLEFYHLMGHNAYEGGNYSNSCNNTIHFIPADSTNQIVVDILDYEDQTLTFSDGDGNPLRSLVGGNDNDYSPVVSSHNALNIAYSGNMYYAGFKLNISQTDNNGCRMVSNITTFVETTTVHLTWTENGNATQWQIEYGIKGFALGTGTVYTATSNSVSFSNLQELTEYDFYIRSICGGNHYGQWNKVSLMIDGHYWQDIVTSQPAGYVIDTASNSVQISTAEELTWWAKTGIGIDGHLVADIDLSGYKWQPTELSNRNFSGHGHTITNMFVLQGNGFFSESSAGSLIEDVGITHAYIKSNSDVGGLCGLLVGTIRNCYVSNSVIEGGYYAGGLVNLNSGTIVNCYVNAEVIGSQAGLLTCNTNGTIRNCYAAGKLRIRSWCYNAGLAAVVQEGEISHCYSVDEGLGVVGTIIGTASLTNLSTFAKSGNNWVLSTPVAFDDVTETDLLSALNRGVEMLNDSAYCTWVTDAGNGNSDYPIFGNKIIVQCPNVTDVSVQNVTVNNNYAVSVSWTGNSGASQWSIRYRRHDRPDTVFTVVTTTDNPCIIYGIPMGYEYDFSVRAICDANHRSGWCETQTVVVDLPFWTDVVTTQPAGYVEDADGNVEISSAEGLAWLAVVTNGFHNQEVNFFEGKTVTLKSDIDLEGYRWFPIANSFIWDGHTYQGGFSGKFDGQDHRVSNIYVNTDFSGLFGTVYQGSVQNVILDGGLIICNGGGGLISYALNCDKITNCHSSVTIYSKGRVEDYFYSGRAGALCGAVECFSGKTIVSNCSSSGTVYGGNDCGNLIGHVTGYVEIYNCYATGDVNLDAEFNYGSWRGGLIGYLMPGNIIEGNACSYNCFSTGVVEFCSGKVIGNTNTATGANSHIHYIYSRNDINEGRNLIGNNCDDIVDTSQFHHDGNANTLLSPVSIDGGSYFDLLDALNAWVTFQNDSTLRTWILDTLTGYPVFGDFFIPTCSVPSELTVSQATVVGEATIKTRLEWSQEEEPDHWEVLYVATGQNITSGTSGTIVSVNSNPCVLAGIPIGEPLDFYVRAVCGGNDKSGWRGPVTYIPDKLHWTEVVTSKPEGFQTDGHGNVYISSAEGLSWLSSVVNGLNGAPYEYFNQITLTNDIDLSAYRWTPINDVGNLIPFSFNGNNHVVSGLYCKDFSKEHQGLFGFVFQGTICNLILTHCDVLGGKYVGAICGRGWFCNINNCLVSGDVEGSIYVGGIAGAHSFGGNTENSCFIGTVSGYYYLGGICEAGTLSNCYTASIVGNDDNKTYYNVNNSGFFGSGTSWMLNTPQYINGAFHTDLVDALNAWVDTNNTNGQYNHWVADTNMVNGGYPVFESISLPAVNIQDTVVTQGYYSWHGMVFTSNTIVTDTISTIFGYDSIVTHYIFVTPAPITEITIDTCGSYIWNGETYSKTGDYAQTIHTTSDVDSVVILHLTINPLTGVDEQLIYDNNYTWVDGATYVTDNNTATHTLQTTDGCDSIVTLHLTLYYFPTVTTASVGDIATNWVTCGGNVIHDGGAIVTTRGVCWNTSQNPTIADAHTTDGIGTGSYTSNIVGLTPNTTYYVRAYATNNGGTSYGEEVVFTTTAFTPPTFTCGDSLIVGSNSYTTHQYGSQCWMTENLRNANESERINWPDVLQACPIGWHLPNDDEWNTLGNYMSSHSPSVDFGNGDYWTSTTRPWADGEGNSYTFIAPSIVQSNSVVTGGGGIACEVHDAANCDCSAQISCISVRCIRDEIVSATLPTVITNVASEIEATSAISGGNITDDGGATVIARGVCWSTLHNPTIADAHTIDGTGMRTFTSNITDLIPNTTYFVRAYATNSEGTSYGQEVSLTTPCDTATHEFNVSTCNSFIWSGTTYTKSGHYPITFTSVYGCDSVVTLHLTITNYITEFFEAIAIDSYIWDGDTLTESGDYSRTFTASNGCDSVVTMHLTVNLSTPPTVTTSTVSGITAYSAICGGTVTSDGGAGVTERGVCWSTSQSPTLADSHTIDGNGIGIFSSQLTGLEPNTTYHVRAYATNHKGTTYGEERVFTTSLSFSCGENLVVGDYSYNTMNYGSQCWMTQNLRDASGSEYFTWEAAKLTCPNGWHMPTIGEWDTLASYVDNNSDHDSNIPLFFAQPSYGSFWVDWSVPWDENTTLVITYEIYGQTIVGYSGFNYEANQTGLQVLTRCLRDENAFAALPTVTTDTVSDITPNTATCGGNVTADGGATVTARGVCWSISENPTVADSHTTDGGGAGAFTSQLTGLELNTTYHARAYATNSSGTAYGEDVTFTTGCSSMDVTITSDKTAICKGECATLHAFGANSYIWSTGENSSNIIDCPYTTTSYSVTGFDQYGCESATSFTLMVIDLSATPVVTVDNATVCDGSSVTLSVTNPNTDPSISYTWYRDSVVIPGATQAIIVDYPTAADNEVSNHVYTVVVSHDNSSCISDISEPTVVTVNFTNNTELFETACNSYSWNDSVYFQSGDYTQTLTNANGCDSIVSLHLIVNHSDNSEHSEIACNLFTWEGTTYTTSGDYTQTFAGVNGCDSVVTLHLTVNYANSGDTTAVADDRFDWFEHTYLTMSGNYTHVFTNQNGCDSVVTLHLTVNNPTISVQDTVMTAGYFIWHGMVFTSDTVLTEIIPVLDGYDSLMVYHIFVTPTPLTVLTVDACVSYTLNGQTYAESGDYVQTFPIPSGIDSVVVLYLTISPADSTDFAETACEFFTWEGTTYTTSGDYTKTFTNTSGCDSVVTLHLTIFLADSTDFAETACDSYEWNGETFTTSGDYTRTLTNASGCDSVVTLHLTIQFATYTQFADTACGSYEWNGTTYTVSGDYEQTFTAANGCDSVATLHLTVNQPSTGTDVQTACGSYTWIDGISYSESNSTATYTLTNAVGCDSIVTLNLTIFPADSTDFAETVCESYEWNGETFITSGDHTRTLTNMNGCDSVVTLHLTVNQPVAELVEATACGSYEWNGQTYTISGDYEQSFTAANGCDSIVTLHLTVNYGTHNIETETACESFTWHGATYTTSGTYTYEYTNANGCVSVDTLHLTVNHGTHYVESETACESFTWHGTEYTASGTYTYEYTNADGCASVDTLHLTINFAQSAQFAVTTADSCYIWNAETYCESGDYTQTLTAANGCDSVVTLHLTITVGIDDHNGFAFKLYPNPTNGVVNVQCTMNNVQVGTMEFHVFDAYGNLVDVVKTRCTMSLQTAQIDLSGFAAGVYFVKAVADGNVVAVKKVVKQ